MAKKSAWETLDFGARPDTDPKVQLIRTVDVLLLGPTMIAAAVRSDLPKPLRYFLGVAGAATIVFNGVNLAIAADRSARGR